MKNAVKKYAVLIIWAVVMVIFNLLALVLPKDLGEAKIFFWGGFAFINVAFVLIGVIMFLMQKGKGMQITNAAVVYTACGLYFAVTFLLNFIYMCIYDATNKKAVFIPNVIILLLFVIVLVYLFVVSNHAEQTGQVLKEKAVVLENFEVRVQALCLKTEDFDVKKALDDLHNDVKFSDSMSVPAAADSEKDFILCLQQISELLDDETAETEAVLKAVKKAKNAWKIRNEFVQIYKRV